jgi:hypothetical protein
MTYPQLSRYIGELRQSGYQVLEHEVELYRKVAFPFVTLVMTFIAVPFAVTTGRRGAMYGIGVGIVLALVYWTMISVFAAFGAGGLMSPLLPRGRPACCLAPRPSICSSRCGPDMPPPLRDQKSFVRALLGVLSLVAAIVVVAAGFTLLVAAMQAGERGTRPFFNAVAVLGVGGGLLAAGIALLIWEMSIRYDVRK